MQKYHSIIFGGAAFVVAIAVIAGAFFLLTKSNFSEVIGLPMLAVGAVVLLLFLLAAMSLVFALFGLQDQSQALALPEGSIRAVIALMLIVLFAVLSVYLYGSLNEEGRMVEIGTITADEYARIKDSASAKELLVITTGNELKVLVRHQRSEDGVDFAKQLLVLVGTLVTSIASFYFGAKTVSEAKKAPDSDPVLQSVDPTSVNRGQTVTFLVRGSRLTGVRIAKLVQGEKEIAGAALKAAQDQVTFQATIPADAPTGFWNLLLIDAEAKSWRPAGAVKVE
jgi:hypothetical protein